MNMSQATKLEPCLLLDELVIERDVLLRDLTDKIEALESVR